MNRRYTFQSQDPRTATWTGEEKVQVSGGYISKLPTLAQALAFKLLNHEDPL